MMLDQAALVAPAEGIALDEPLGEADDADLEAPRRCVRCVAVPSVISTLPPPMSMTTAVRAADVDAVAGREVDEPRFLSARRSRGRGCPVCRSTSAMKSPPLSASRVALVAPATISSTLWDSAMRRNLESVWSAAPHGRRRQAAAVEAAGAEPDHFLFAVDDLERQVGAHLHHDHVDRVGADVDGSDAHAGKLC